MIQKLKLRIQTRSVSQLNEVERFIESWSYHDDLNPCVLFTGSELEYVWKITVHEGLDIFMKILPYFRRYPLKHYYYKVEIM